MKSILIIFFCMTIVTSCTKDGGFYDAKKHKESDKSAVNTLLAIGGTIALINEAIKGGYGGNGSSLSSQVVDYDWDWDYQPGNGQWACRGIQTGQYASKSNCANDFKNDSRWP